MDWSVFARDLVVAVLVGALAGLVVGLVLVWSTDAVDNPFWSVSLGIVAGAVAAGVRRSRT